MKHFLARIYYRESNDSLFSVEYHQGVWYKYELNHYNYLGMNMPWYDWGWRCVGASTHAENLSKPEDILLLEEF